MLQYKSVPLPATVLDGIKSKDLFTLETAAKATAPVGRVLENEAKGGWRFHAMDITPATLIRKKGLLEKILGWIPIIGRFFIPANALERYTVNYIMLIFEKEV